MATTCQRSDVIDVHELASYAEFIRCIDRVDVSFPAVTSLRNLAYDACVGKIDGEKSELHTEAPKKMSMSTVWCELDNGGETGVKHA